MKRLLLIAILGGAALVPLAAQAQRGMGVRGGVAPSRVSSGFAARPMGRPGPIGTVRPMGIRVASPQSRVVLGGQRTFSPRNRFAFNRFDRFHRFHHRRFFNNGAFFNNCFNTFGTAFGCSPFFNSGFGFGGFGFGDPFFDPFFASEWQQPQPQQQPVVVENEGGNREVAFEVQALRDEIEAMRDEERARNEARNNAAAKSPAQPDDKNAVLVFQDGRQLSVRNYAIADHTIWVLSSNSARKIPISDLNVTATEQANANNGVEFHLPH
jgi:hypothetical protein